MIEKMTKNEVKELWRFIELLSDYHNNVSKHFSGLYPMNKPAETIKVFEDDIESGKSMIYVYRDDGLTKGFVKLDIEKTFGTVSYLFVEDKYRGEGVGDALSDAALETFKEYGVKQIDVKVVYGSPTVDYYEKRGFKKQQYIMTREI